MDRRSLYCGVIILGAMTVFSVGGCAVGIVPWNVADSGRSAHDVPTVDAAHADVYDAAPHDSRVVGADAAAAADAPSATDVSQPEAAADVSLLPTDAGGSVQRSCASATTPGCGLIDIPGGTFTLGDPAATNGAPVQPSITVSALRVDAYEVTVARFRAFWNDGHPSAGSVPYPGGTVDASGVVTEPYPQNIESPINWSPTALMRESFPVDAVDWTTAMAFCVWDGGRLPTEAEWEWIARGRATPGLAAPRVYPWGDTMPSSVRGSCDRANFAECEGDPFRAVGSFAATGGLFDLAGNVAEWTADNYQSYGAGPCWTGAARTDPLCNDGSGTHTVRGGSWASLAADVQSAARGGVATTIRDGVYGMRCVRAR